MSFAKMLGTSFIATPNATTPKKVSTSTPRSPIDADLRIFKNGSVYPSVSLVTDYQLQYQNKNSEFQGNGFDVIDSRTLSNTQNTPVPFLMIAPVSKKLGKVDLFNACTYNEEGTPQADVTTQGASSFGKGLWNTLMEIYNLDTTKYTEQGYIDLDLEVVESISESLAKATNGVYYLPKTITRGERIGQTQVVRRENLSISILSPSGEIFSKPVVDVSAANISGTTQVGVAPVVTTNNSLQVAH